MKKLLASLLSVMMVMCFMPGLAWAADDNVASVGSNEYGTLQDAIDAANDGDTVTLLSDLADTGAVKINKNITFDGNQKKISGDSSIYIGTFNEVTIENLKMENIENSAQNLSAIYAPKLSGTLTIMNCEFGYCNWDTIQITPEDGAVINISDNKFSTNENADKKQVRFVHIESKTNTDFSATVTENIMKNKLDGLNGIGGACGALEVYYFTDEGKINISKNYIEDTTDCCVLENSGNNVGEMIYPLYKSEAKNESDMINPVAAIKTTYGGSYYESLDSAVLAVGTGETITLLTDIQVNNTINVAADKNFILDLGGKTLSGNSAVLNVSGQLEIKNGTVKMENKTGSSGAALWLRETGKVTVDEDATICSVDSADPGFAVGIWSDCKGAEFVLKGKLSGENGLTINGNSTSDKNTVSIVQGSEIDVTGTALYLAGKGNTSVDNASIKGGVTGIEIRAGELTIDGENTAVSGGTGELKTEANGKGTTVQNAALAISQHTTKQPINVTVNNGKFSGTAAICETNIQNPTDTSGITIAVTDGDFTGSVSCMDCDKFISGGTFDRVVPEGLLAAQKEAYKMSNGKFIVEQETAENAKPTIPNTPGYEWVKVDGSYVEKPIYIPSVPTTQKPVIEADANATVTLSDYGTKATIKVADGYELVDVTVNGVSKGKVDTLTGLKTGDKVVVTTKKIDTTADEIAAVKATKLVARSANAKAPSGKKAIKVYWFNKDGSELNFDGYEIYRSTKKNSGYGKKPIYTAKKTQYFNTSAKKGIRYYYKVRGYKVIGGEKVYTDFSLKAIRTAK